jgi:GNAT superfamily N-acetyltransferase
MPTYTYPSRPIKRPRRLPTGEIEIVRVSTPLDFAQSALLLGEQRAYTERLIGYDLDEVQPSAQFEYAFLSDFYSPPNGQLLLARVAEAPVGVIGVRRLDEDLGECKRFFVRRSARGLGIGRMLVTELLSLSRSLGFQSLYAETWPAKMSASYEMCRRLGFRDTAKRNFHDVDGIIAMQLPLDAIAA